MFLSVGILCLLLACLSSTGTQASPGDHCVTLDRANSKIVCICNKQHCDDFEYIWPRQPGEAHLISSTRQGQRFVVTQLDAGRESGALEKAETIYVNVGREHQQILGWGGAITDSSGVNIRSLSKQVGDKIIDSYYGQNGLEYNFGRVPISGADFSTRTYSYDDSHDYDYNLTLWSLQEEDIKYKIPIIKQAMDLTSKRNVSLNLFGSSWSPPEWMKANHNFVRGHLLNDSQIYTSYANYLVQFYEAYKAQGVHFWGGTVQNEPVTANSPAYSINSLQMTNNEMATLISDYLGPALEAKGYTKDKFKLMVGDDNLDAVKAQVPEVMAHEGVKKFVSGLAFHWYNSGTPGVPYDTLLEVLNKIKDDIDFVLMTEACNGFDYKPPLVDLGSWERAEKYALDIIQDLLRLAAGWVDWNLCLDTGGGPNWANNFVDSAIIVDKKNDQFFKQPMYYALGHFSKFLRPGSMRVATSLKGQRSPNAKLMSVAAIRKDTNHLVVVVLNKYDHIKGLNIRYRIPSDSPAKSTEKVVLAKVQARSINTIVIKL